MSALPLIHVCSAVIGIIAGYVSVVLRKGSSMHRIAGNIFTVSMLCMGSTGAYMAVFLKPNVGNFAGGMMMVYLVSTGWMAGRRREARVNAFDVGAFALAIAIGAGYLNWGIQAKLSPKGSYDGYPATMFFIFGSLTLLFAASDVRMLLRRGVSGASRLGRHLWRMSFTLLFATLSAYPGNKTRLFSQVPQTGLLYLPHILLAVSTVYWLIRIRVRRRRAAAAAAEWTPLPAQAN
jgi:uncharacterized membrane protein